MYDMICNNRNGYVVFLLLTDYKQTNSDKNEQIITYEIPFVVYKLCIMTYNDKRIKNHNNYIPKYHLLCTNYVLFDI